MALSSIVSRSVLKFGNVGFCGESQTGVPGEKPLKQRRDQQQTQPTFDVNTGNQTPATLAEGECFHPCAIPVPLVNVKQLGWEGGGGAAHPASTPQDCPVNAMFVTSLTAKDHKT